MESPGQRTSCSLTVTHVVPNVPTQEKLYVGMTFEELENAFAFYNRYAKLAGFSVRKESLKKTKDGVIRGRVYTCYKEGLEKNAMLGIDTERCTQNIRNGCMAMLGVSRTRNSVLFKVYRFEEAHNHYCETPSKVHLLKSHRNLSEAKKKLFSTMQSNNISIPRAMGIFIAESSGAGDVGFLEADLRNYVRDENAKVKGQDAQLFVEHFMLEKEHNSSFFYKVRKDSTNKIELAFWADPTCRRSYHFFGDTVALDSTYNTNTYGFPFAPFVGVNHHFQSILFGCAFMNKENFESYLWILEAFLEAMPGPPPNVIITDQDPALSKAIARALPNAYHRYCMWHIIRKIPEKVGSIINSLESFSKIYCIIKYSETAYEFEAKWQGLVDEVGLGDNEWISYMFQVREQWVPAYFKNVFAASMSSTQRSETTHSFLKKFVYKGCSFNEFVTRFGRALSRQRERENDSDHKDRNGRPKLQYGTQMELQVANTYTSSMFREFQRGLHNCFTYGVDENIEGDMSILKLTYRGLSNDIEIKKSRIVTMNRLTQIGSCSCKQFEFMGIPCAHILRVLDCMNMYEVPSFYIIDRWKKGTRRQIVIDRAGNEIREDHRREVTGGNSKAYDAFLNGYYDLISESLEDQEFGLELLQEWRQKFNDHMSKKPIENNKSSKEIETSSTVEYLEPDHARHKGCGKRLKSSMDKGPTLNRLCRVCKGHGHDKRNCPKNAKGGVAIGAFDDHK
ncbi:unnamed protein product [Cuscuta epithymum]|uniref:SWIM-type domain-containing protein n=1 Tax=Cuscuta epithymum TaxID=186058 RepID=A0AAV0DGN3_9ASTE|nr:unnamed protein product [Cuscuta epithymum]